MDEALAGSDSAIEITPKELMSNSEGTVISVTTEVSDADKEKLWKIVQDGFLDLNKRSYDRQDMTYEEFMADMDSPSVLKYIATDENQNPIGYLAARIGLDGIDWADTDTLRAEQSKLDPAAQSYYITTVVVSPDHRGSQTATSLLQGALVHFKKLNTEMSQDSLCFFDCANANHPWLAEFISKVAAAPAKNYAGIPVEVKELFEQQYVKPSQGGDVFKTEGISGENSDYTIVDKQHFYSMRIADPA